MLRVILPRSDKDRAQCLKRAVTNGEFDLAGGKRWLTAGLHNQLKAVRADFTPKFRYRDRRERFPLWSRQSDLLSSGAKYNHSLETFIHMGNVKAPGRQVFRSRSPPSWPRPFQCNHRGDAHDPKTDSVAPYCSRNLR